MFCRDEASSMVCRSASRFSFVPLLQSRIAALSKIIKVQALHSVWVFQRSSYGAVWAQSALQSS